LLRTSHVVHPYQVKKLCVYENATNNIEHSLGRLPGMEVIGDLLTSPVESKFKRRDVPCSYVF